MTRSIVTLVLLLGACTTEHVDQRNARIDQGDGKGAGDPGTEGDGCANILATDCNPDGKHYTPEDIARCEAAREHDYNGCVAYELCDAARVPAERACYAPDGSKPAEGTPDRPAFDQCFAAVWAAFESCLQTHGGLPTGDGTGGG